MLRLSRFTFFKKAATGGRLPKSSRRRTLHEMLEGRWLLDAAPYVELNLASNQPNTALVADQSLDFASGIATSPGASGGFSVSDTLLGRSSAYSGDVAGSPLVATAGASVEVPSPTGQVYNGNTNEFFITSPPPPPGMEPPTIKAPAEFLYASLDGTIYGFNSQIGQHAVAAVSVPNTAFTGITIANNGTADQLYAVDVLGRKIDVFDTSFSPVTTSGAFTDPNLPAGFVPLNIKALGGDLYVSYVSPPTPAANSGLPIGLAPGGVVDAFDANGNFLGRIASGSPLDQPVGMAIAPPSFGQFAGDGKINAFDPTPDPAATTGTSLGTLSDADGNPFVIDGLLGLSFGNGDNAGDSGALYFTAGTLPLTPAGGNGTADNASIAVPLTHGLIGSIQVAGTSPLVAVGTDLSAVPGDTLTRVLAAFGSGDTSSPVATPAVSTTNPVASYTATIDWGDGSSTTNGTVLQTAEGGYLVVGSHSYASAGTDNYTVTIHDHSSNSATATGAVHVTAATLAAHALTIESQGLSVRNATVAEFVDTGGVDPLGNYSATINWGDGTSATAGTVTNGILPLDGSAVGGLFSVAGSHTYAATGEYTFTVTIDDSDGSTATVQGTVDVVPATIEAKALPVFSPSLSVDNATVALFHDTGGADPLANYTATIDWGDGSSASAGTVSAGISAGSGTGTTTAGVTGSPINGDDFSVAGSHSYAAAGDYTFTVTIDDSDGTDTTVTGTVEVSQPTLVAKGLTITGSGLAVDNGTVASFLDTGGSDPLTNYTATIDWGDGTSSAGTVSGGNLIPGGGTGGPAILTGAEFSVTGSHDYTASGEYTTTITIRDSDGTNATAQGAVEFVVGTLHLQPVRIESHGLSVNNAVVADFYDSSGADQITNYSATIDWGDGVRSAATVTPATMPLNGNQGVPGGLFDVSGSHTYASLGTYTIAVIVNDDHDSIGAGFQETLVVAAAKLEAKAVPVLNAGLAVSNVAVADFIDTDGGDPLTNYSATIEWGDGTPASTATITAIAVDGGTGTGTATPSAMPSVIIGGEYYSVEGSHTYAATGDYSTTITISDSDGTSATVTGSVAVSAPTLHAHALPVVGQGLNVSSAAVADFYDTGGSDPRSNYSATIDWGDGSSASAGNIGPGVTPLDGRPNVGLFDVTGSHSYAAAGTYTFTVTITDTDGTSATVTGTVDVAPPTLEAKALPVIAHGLSVNQAVADFIDTGGGDSLANYTATIDWGDNSTSAGTINEIVADPPGGPLTAMPGGVFVGLIFEITGSHTYASAGDYTITVAIADSDGTSATVTGTASVATPTLEAKVLPVYSPSLTLTNTVVANFADTGGSDPVANYSATINWGDGSSATAGTVTLGILPGASPKLAGLFSVAGSHTYTAPGDYTMTVAISDSDGTSTTATGTVSVAQAPLLAVGVPVVVNSGLSVNNAIVAALTDAAGGDSVSNYSATIDWGDGSSTSAGTVSGSGNSYVVNGSHAYAASGDYEFTVSITDSDGSKAVATAHVYADAPTASYVANAFQGVLHRSPDDSGLNYWSQQITSGLAPSQFASDLTHSAEFYATNVIQPAYQQYLGRSADTSGVAYWTSQMQQGLTDQQIEANFIASDEFYAKAGGTDADWVNAMYQTVLGRPADSAGLSYWLSQLASGASRTSVATGFAASQEREAQIIQQDYFTYLGRSASAAEVDYWVAQFDNGATNEDIVSGFVGSPEYVKLHS